MLIALTCLDVCYQIKTRRPSATVVPLGYGCSPRLRLFQFVTTHNLLTQLCPHTTCPHNLLTHNLSPHNLSTHNLLTHNLHTHNLSPHNLLAHTPCSHTTCHHTTCHHTTCSHTTCHHTTYSWQAWHLWHWAVWWRAWFPFGAVDAAAVCVAGVALGDIDRHFAWQAWHLATSIVTLRGRRGTYGTGLALVALGSRLAPSTPPLFA